MVQWFKWFNGSMVQGYVDHESLLVAGRVCTEPRLMGNMFHQTLIPFEGLKGRKVKA